MAIEHTEVVWLEERSDYTIHELVALSGLPRQVLDDLVECGALPVQATPQVRFEAESVALARAAGRLREIFELEQQGLAVAVTLLRRVRILEARLAAAPPVRDNG